MSLGQGLEDLGWASGDQNQRLPAGHHHYQHPPLPHSRRHDHHMIIITMLVTPKCQNLSLQRFWKHDQNRWNGENESCAARRLLASLLDKSCSSCMMSIRNVFLGCATGILNSAWSPWLKNAVFMMIYMFNYLIWDTYAQKWVKTLRLWCLYQNSQLFGCPCLHLGAWVPVYFRASCWPTFKVPA